MTVSPVVKFFFLYRAWYSAAVPLCNLSSLSGEERPTEIFSGVLVFRNKM